MLLFTEENFVDTLVPSALTATMAITAMRASSRPYSTRLAPRSSLALNRASSHVFRTNRSIGPPHLGARGAHPAFPLLPVLFRGIGRCHRPLHRPIDSMCRAPGRLEGAGGSALGGTGSSPCGPPIATPGPSPSADGGPGAGRPVGG